MSSTQASTGKVVLELTARDFARLQFCLSEQWLEQRRYTLAGADFVNEQVPPTRRLVLFMDLVRNLRGMARTHELLVAVGMDAWFSATQLSTLRNAIEAAAACTLITNPPLADAIELVYSMIFPEKHIEFRIAHYIIEGLRHGQVFADLVQEAQDDELPDLVD
ncbi:hypothetical protein CPC08DRAFT_728186 [Agrocybe pediades]|nr:hypothetical protein CPC08DRAFT_728186 [Agrocybe pediades]